MKNAATRKWVPPYPAHSKICSATHSARPCGLGLSGKAASNDRSTTRYRSRSRPAAANSPAASVSPAPTG